MNNTIVTPGVGTIKPDAELNVMKEEITRELTMSDVCGRGGRLQSLEAAEGK